MTYEAFSWVESNGNLSWQPVYAVINFWKIIIVNYRSQLVSESIQIQSRMRCSSVQQIIMVISDCISYNAWYWYQMSIDWLTKWWTLNTQIVIINGYIWMGLKMIPRALSWYSLYILPAFSVSPIRKSNICVGLVSMATTVCCVFEHVSGIVHNYYYWCASTCSIETQTTAWFRANFKSGWCSLMWHPFAHVNVCVCISECVCASVRMRLNMCMEHHQST